MSQDKKKKKKKALKPFFAQGVYGCVSYPRLRCNGKQASKKDKKRQVSKVVMDNAYTTNEINIGKKISAFVKDVPKHMFVFFHHSCEVEKRQIEKNDTFADTCKLLHRGTHFKILYGPYIPSITLHEHWSFVDDERVFSLYTFMLHAIGELLKHGIVHNDLKANNILVHEDDHKKYSVVDFGLSLDVEKCVFSDRVANDYMKRMFILDLKYDYWSVEHHIICYYMKRGKIVDKDRLLSFCKYVINHSLCSTIYSAEDVHDHYKDILYEDEAHVVISSLFQNSHKTWDLYSLAYICFNEIAHKTYEKDALVNLLHKALHYDYTLRPTIEQHKTLFDAISFSFSWKSSLNHWVFLFSVCTPLFQ